MLNESAIVFCIPPISLKKLYGILASGGAFVPPLNLLSLAAQTRDNGYKTAIIDCSAEKLDFEQSAKKIISFNTKYIGITATTLSINDAARLARKIKDELPSSVIIIGGVHVTALPIDTLRKYVEFDIGVCGEGELTIINLLDALRKNKDLHGVRGIVFRSDGQIKVTEKQPLINDLDILPLPAWDLLDGFATRYAPTTSRMTGLPSIYINSARGCPYQCIFCDRSVLGNSFRAFSEKRVVQMIQKAKEMYKVKHITIYDENMAINRQRVVDLSRMLLEARLNINWSCDMRADFICRNEDIPQLIYEAGCRGVNFGVESGNQRILDFYKKGETLGEIKKAVSLVHKAGINTTGFFIIGGPTETISTIKDTIAFAAELELDYAVALYFTAFPGSTIYKDIRRYGEFKEDWDQYNSFVPLFLPFGVTQKDLERLFHNFFTKFYFRPKRIVKILCRNLNINSLWRLFTTGAGIIPLLMMRIVSSYKRDRTD